ncbi:hypothetical protein E8E13_001560 [Curvularia kusanoi]|uniref:Uncharacterized protein n=1 Tax=Curvularia kusanoi TaxID=90978 RepID=A0A9P4T492_CURKU|nr:hypothetical protein E8E13_001560 [Curvularia kusanoi]
MATEAPQPVEAAAHDAPPPPEPPVDAAHKPVKRSWRRKYRKMRIRFDDAMSQSNAYIMEEWKAMGTARRLQAENDQLLDALLDFNNQPRVPARQRFDLNAPNAGLSSDAAAAAAAAQQLDDLRAQLNAGTITPDQYAQQADQLHNSSAIQQVLKSLDTLEGSVPHTTLTDSTALPSGIDLSDHAPGYMSPTHEEEYLLALDALLEDPSFDPHTTQHHRIHLGPPQPQLSEKDLTIRNPDSVYNWLRKNQPQVFLQDKDAAPGQGHHDNVSEKAAPKGGSKKSRASNIGGAGTPGPKEDHDAEDSAAPEGGKAARGKKAAADPDDTAYRPKGGSSRPAKRKREAGGDGEAKGARKKNRPSAVAGGAASTPAPATPAAQAQAPGTPTPAAPAPPTSGQ